MTRDFASRSRSQPKFVKAKSSQTYRWAALGILLGGGLFLLIVLILHYGDSKKQNLSQSVDKITKKSKAPVLTKKTTMQFDFYNILPKEKVWVPKAAEKPFAVPEAPQAPIAYILQVAAFKTKDQAKALQAKLILKGYHAHVKTSQNGDWFKVWLGPFQNLSTVQSVQVGVSISNHLSGLIVKISEN